MKFYNNSSIKKNIYSLDFTIGGSNKRSVILIIHHKNTFLINDSWYSAWLKKNDIFL